MPVNHAFFYDKATPAIDMKNIKKICRTLSGNFVVKNFDDDQKIVTIDEAVELTGNGWYNYGLMLVVAFMLQAMAIDLFGMSVIVVGAGCDFQLTLGQKSILTSLPLGGAAVMSFVWGYIADTKGRKKCLVIAMVVNTILTIIRSFSPHWIFLGVTQFLSSCFSCCAQSAGITLMAESCSKKYQNTYSIVINSGTMSAVTVYMLVGYFVLNLDFSYDMGLNLYFTPWRLLSLIFAIPPALCFIFLIFFHESPKFLANHGQENRALDILRDISRRNGGKDYSVKKLIRSPDEDDIQQRPKFHFFSMSIPLFKPPLLKHTLQLFYLAFICYSVANGLYVWIPYIINVLFEAVLRAENKNISKLCDLIIKGDEYTDTYKTHDPSSCIGYMNAETTITGTVSNIILVLINIIQAVTCSRKKIMLNAVFVISCAAGISSILVPNTIGAVVLFMLILIIKLGQGVTFAYTMELYPTSHRSTMAGLIVIVARVSGVIGVNVIGYLILDHCEATFYGCSVFVLSGVLVVLMLPSDRVR